ncbi:hypothetical protein GJ496_011467 [Pomphorhynchus laevis]|nr:hypothetical protein GJ496_011467 [Pomphorhynchus laevis]
MSNITTFKERMPTTIFAIATNLTITIASNYSASTSSVPIRTSKSAMAQRALLRKFQSYEFMYREYSNSFLSQIEPSEDRIERIEPPISTKKTITIRKTAEFNSFGFEIEQCTESSKTLISSVDADSNSVKPTPTPSHHTSLEYFDADDIVDKRNTNSADAPKPLIKPLAFDEVSQKQELRSDKISKPAFDAVNIKEIITQFDDCHITDKPLFDSDATINDAPFKHETTEHGNIDQNESSNTISQMKDIEKQFTDEKDISNNNISVLDKKPLYSSRAKPEVNSEYKVQDNTRSSLKIEGQAKSKVLSLRNAFEDQSHAKEIKTLTPKKSRSNQNLLNIGLQTNDQQTYGVSMPLIKSSFESDSQIAPTRFTREDVIKEQQPILKSELSFDLSDIPGSGTAVRIESLLIEMTNDGVDVEVRSNYRLCCDRCSLMYKGFKGRYL